MKKTFLKTCFDYLVRMFAFFLDEVFKINQDKALRSLVL